MDTVIVNCGNSKTHDPHRLLLNLSDKMKLKRSEKYVVFIKSQHVLFMVKYEEVI